MTKNKDKPIVLDKDRRNMYKNWIRFHMIFEKMMYMLLMYCIIERFILGIIFISAWVIHDLYTVFRNFDNEQGILVRL